MHYVFRSSGKSENLRLRTKNNAKALLQKQNDLIELMSAIVADEEDLSPIVSSIDSIMSFIRFLENLQPNTFYERDTVESWRTEFPQFEQLFSCFERKNTLEPNKPTPISLHRQVLLQNFQSRISNKLEAIEGNQNVPKQPLAENSVTNRRNQMN